MAIKDNKITSWVSPVINEADRPQRTASEMKAVFDSNSNQLRQALNGLIDDLSKNGAAELPAAPLDGVDGITVEEQLTGLKKYADEREEAAKEYADNLSFGSGAADMRKSVYDPQGKAQDVFAYADNTANSLRNELDKDVESLRKELDEFSALPSGGTDGQVLVKTGETEGAASWQTLYSYGTEDLEAGVSELATGKLHFVYE